jgi:hypothetical protein
MTNKFSSILILFIAILTMNFRCVKDDLIERPFEQTFKIPVDIYPLKKTYSLTDTIWIETDIVGKTLFDTKSNQLILVDTGQIDFGASFNIFGTQITNPQSGFCDIITVRGVNNNRELGHWGTSGYLGQYGCGLPTYKCRIGFKPLIRGTYWLILTSDRLFGSCTNKVVPYYANVFYRYKTSDLGLEIFNALSKNDKGGNDGIKFYTDKINNRETFVFKVE